MHSVRNQIPKLIKTKLPINYKELAILKKQEHAQKVVDKILMKKSTILIERNINDFPFKESLDISKRIYENGKIGPQTSKNGSVHSMTHCISIEDIGKSNTYSVDHVNNTSKTASLLDKYNYLHLDTKRGNGNRSDSATDINPGSFLRLSIKDKLKSRLLEIKAKNLNKSKKDDLSEIIIKSDDDNLKQTNRIQAGSIERLQINEGSHIPRSLKNVEKKGNEKYSPFIRTNKQIAKNELKMLSATGLKSITDENKNPNVNKIVLDEIDDINIDNDSIKNKFMEKIDSNRFKMRLGGTFNEECLSGLSGGVSSSAEYQDFNPNVNNPFINRIRKKYLTSPNVQSANSLKAALFHSLHTTKSQSQFFMKKNNKDKDKGKIISPEDDNLSSLMSPNQITRKNIASPLGSYQQHINKFHMKKSNALPNICKSSISKDKENEWQNSIDNNDHEISQNRIVGRDQSKNIQIETFRMKKIISPMERNIEGFNSNKVSSRDTRIEDMPPNYFVDTSRTDDVHIANNIKKSLLKNSRYKSEINKRRPSISSNLIIYE